MNHEQTVETDMMVMPSNLNNLALRLEVKHPSRLGLLISPTGKVNPQGLPYALDNDRFTTWAKGKPWDSGLFRTHLEWSASLPIPPLWVVVPDVPADATRTLHWWDRWLPRVEKYNFPPALAVQDGMTPETVRQLDRSPDVIFVGGTTRWKLATIPTWCRYFSRVHVGRVNTSNRLWACHHYGVESVDGTGWWHTKQLAQLKDYLIRSDAGLDQNDGGFNF